MKNLFFICLVLCIGLLLSNNVEAKVLPISVGVHGGLNIGNASVDMDSGTSPDMKSKTGFLFGGFAELNLGVICLQPELNYIQKNSQADFSYMGSTFSTTNKLTYMEIPVLLKYKLSTPLLKPYFLAGPSFGMLMSAKQDDNNESGKDVKDEYSGTEFGLMLGAGVEYPLMPLTSIVLDFRYSMGLNDIYKGKDTDGIKIKTKGMQILVGVQFGI